MRYLYGIALIAVALVACRKDADYIGTEIILVASKIVEVDNPYQYEIGEWGKCYFIKTAEYQNWHRLNIYRLEGFEHKEGYESLIIVELHRNFSSNQGIFG